jgi:hypothetical protein
MSASSRVILADTAPHPIPPKGLTYKATLPLGVSPSLSRRRRSRVSASTGTSLDPTRGTTSYPRRRSSLYSERPETTKSRHSPRFGSNTHRSSSVFIRSNLIVLCSHVLTATARVTIGANLENLSASSSGTLFIGQSPRGLGCGQGDWASVPCGRSGDRVQATR